MNRKAFVLGAILVILSGIGVWYYGFFTRYNYLTAKSDIAKNNPQIVYVGESMLTPTAMNNLSNKYGFQVIVLGCVISGVEQNGIEIYNSQMDDYIDELNAAGWKSDYKKEIDSLMKLTNIPKTAFWIEKNGNGNWYNIDWVHNHKNNATISIFNPYGDLVVKGHFMLICPVDEIEFMDNLEKQVDFYDGKNIQLKSNCYLLKRG